MRVPREESKTENTLQGLPLHRPGSSLIAVARISKTILNNIGESGHPCLVPDNACCGLLIYGLYYVEVDSFYAHFLKSFNNKSWFSH